MKKFDVAIVGASLAGSFTAYLLGRQGFEVCLLDRPGKKHPKSCGEGLSMLGRRYLEAAGLWTDPIQCTCRSFDGYKIHFLNGKESVLSHKAAIGYSLRRSVLDAHVASSALAFPSVKLQSGSAVGCERSGDNWRINLHDETALHCRHLVIASGYSGRNLFTQPEHRFSETQPLRYGFTLRLNGTWHAQSLRHVIIKQHTDYQLVLTPLLDGVNVCALLEKKEHLGARRDDLRHDMLSFAEAHGFSSLQADEIRGVSFMNSSQAANVPQSVFFVGDSAEIFDPIGGMGMTHALFSGSIAAEAISSALEKRVHIQRAWRRYIRTRARWSSILRMKTGLSYATNVRRSKPIAAAVRLIPSLSMRLLVGLERLFPVIGAVHTPIQGRTQQEHSPVSDAPEPAAGLVA